MSSCNSKKKKTDEPDRSSSKKLILIRINEFKVKIMQRLGTEATRTQI